MSDDPVTEARKSEERRRSEDRRAIARAPMALAGACLGIYVGSVGFSAATADKYDRTVLLAGTPAGWLAAAGFLFAIACVVWMIIGRES